MTTNTAAAELQVSRSAVLKAIKDKRMTAAMIGRDYLIERDEMERYRRERKLTGPRKHRPAPPAADQPAT